MLSRRDPYSGVGGVLPTLEHVTDALVIGRRPFLVDRVALEVRRQNIPIFLVALHPIADRGLRVVHLFRGAGKAEPFRRNIQHLAEAVTGDARWFAAIG